MHSLCRLLALIGAFLVLGLSVGAQEESRYRINIISVEASSFPTVTLRFEILDRQTNQPAVDLPQADIILSEDGKEVYRIKPQVLRRAPSAVALVMDTSGSMAPDRRMEEAKRAAQAFFDRLTPQTLCGLVLFNHVPHTTLTPRKERAEVREQVKLSEPSGGTAYHDAALKALEFFPAKPDESRRALVLMTDGRDVNSEHTLDQAIAEAQRRKVQVFTIGLGKPNQNEFTRTVLVLDRSGSMREGRKMQSLKQAAARFLQLMPTGNADTTVLSFNDRVESADGFTADKAQLKERIEELFPMGETAWYDAAYEGIETLVAAPVVEGKRLRRAVLMLTDGKDNRSRRDVEDVIRRARQEEVRVFTLGLGRKYEIDERAMKYLAEQTGGEYFHVEDAAKLTDTFEQLSINLHDAGIDEASLRKLAEKTGGEYYHIHDSEKLRLKFEEVAHKLENTFTVTYRSNRSVHDGTRRGIAIDFQGVARTETGYATHGLITPQSDKLLYLGLLVGLLGLLAVPALLFGRKSTPSV